MAASLLLDSLEPIAVIVKPLAVAVRHVGQIPQHAGDASTQRPKNGSNLTSQTRNMAIRIVHDAESARLSGFS